MKTISMLIVLLLPINLNSGNKPDVCFTEEEAKTIEKQLDKDKKTIKWQAARWKELVNTKPKIKYKTSDKKIIIQDIEFPIKKDKPLKYTVRFEVDTVSQKLTYFPLKVNLGIMAESGATKFSYVDPKLGLQFLGLEPFKIPFIKGLGFHALVGIQSAGLSISWGWMKRPIENLRIHFYTGITYEAKETFGGGITLNF
jgi:hypothetical protein